MTAIKICGMRHRADLESCREADYLGFVVFTDSSRSLDLGTASDLMSCCGNLRVVVTTETRRRELEGIVRRLDPDALQLHSPFDRKLLESTRDLGVPVWGVMTVRPGACLDREALNSIHALVLDSPGKMPGGNGQVHDWTLSRAIRDEVDPLPVVLAGGITPGNAVDAVRKVSPFALDVSSGVEGEAGKDPVKVRELIMKVRGEDG
ncbi:MAG: phosphoribosylanthranilate isomerase [Methanomassiliicoccales archaeon]|nr:phosphoribosylanthranilate isomerase [Methanomassiliicoccales archaeon]